MATVASSAYSGYLLWELVRRRLTGAYAAAVIGPIWQIVQPVLTVALLTLVFSRWVPLEGETAAGAPQGEGHMVRYGILLCCGLLPWRSMSQAITASANLFVVNSQFLRRTRVSPFIYVWVELLAAAIQFVVIFAAFLALAACGGLEARWAWCQLVPLAALQLALCFGIQLGSAAVGVFVRDLQQVYSVLFQMLFWVTPIAWGGRVLAQAPRWVISANPLWHLVRSYRQVVVHGEWLDGTTWMMLGVLAAGALLIGSLIYRQLAEDIPDFV